MTLFKNFSYQGQNHKPIPIQRRDLSGGQNTRLQAGIIGENQATVLTNVDITVPGQRRKRPGSVLIGDDVGANSFVALHNFTIQGAADQLLGYEGTTLHKSEAEGNWSALKADFTAGQTDVGIINAKESGLSPDDIVIVQNGTDNAFRIDSDGNEQDLGNTNTSPPITTVMAWYRNRVWCLKNDLLYYSDAYDEDYSGAFDRTTNSFRLPVGTERWIVPTRDLGLVVGGENAIWAINPSPTPAVTDKPEPLIEFVGAVSKKGVALVGDDVFFFSQDGLRELKRTVQDKLQTGDSLPLSYQLKTEFEAISWANIANLSMKYFDNKLFIAVPTGAATYNTWVYYPSYNAFTVIDGWNPSAMETYKVSGEVRFYYGKTGDGDVYRGWYGYTDEGTTTTNGTTISMTEEGREEDFGQPLTPKSGAEIEVEAAETSETSNITVSAKLDGGEYSSVGTVSLAGAALPTLPVDLPFTLVPTGKLIRTKLHMDEFAPFRTLQVKLEHTASNTEDVKIHGVNLVAFPDEYVGE